MNIIEELPDEPTDETRALVGGLLIGGIRRLAEGLKAGEKIESEWEYSTGPWRQVVPEKEEP